jgi:uncharacterized Ntn-hydrolase superfamily protein
MIKLSNMKRQVFFAGIAFLSLQFNAIGQDTFSIVAVDSVTGEVGSAGASCVDLFAAGLPDDSFLGQLIPGVGAINTQAYYIPANQNNATTRMNLGETPSQIIQWLISNDVASQPQFRQYGIAAFVSGSPETAAHTGTSTDDYKNHITGPNYSIQGNILLGQEVLDSMEARFLNEDGDLACKLMAALQGANMVGADTRCTSNGSSSLFAFVKVAQPTDVFGSPSFMASVRTSSGAGIEPIDSLQTKFNLVHGCGDATISEQISFDSNFVLYPNPSNGIITIDAEFESINDAQLMIKSIDGKVMILSPFYKTITIDLASFANGVYLVEIVQDGMHFSRRFVKE